MKEINENRQTSMRTSYYLIASVIFGCIAVGFGIMSFKIDFLGFAFVLFSLTALVFGVTTFILLIKKSRENFQLSDIVQLLILFGFAFYLPTILLWQLDNFKSCRAYEKSRLADLKLIRREMMEYISINERLPDANSWCDPLFSHEKNPRMFHELLSHFAYNENLSETPVEQLNGNILLIIEAEDSVNNFGGTELLTQPLTRYEYYLFPWQKYKYIMFVDGTIAKYRKRDGALSKFEGNPDKFGYSSYDEDINSFGPFIKKGSNSYSTLRWK
jgi:hypothetical protein